MCWFFLLNINFIFAMHNWSKILFACIQYKERYSPPGGFFFFFWTNFFFFQLNYSTSWEQMVSEDDYEIWILPQELQSVDINLQSFWSNWCSAEEECNTSCCDVPCILFSTVSGHACHSPLCEAVWAQSRDPALWIFWDSIEGDSTCLRKNKCQQKNMYNSRINVV